MKKRDYDRAVKALDAQINPLLVQKSILTRTFVRECKHPQRSLTMKENSYEDEYGRWMDSWTDYDYECTLCGTRVRKSKTRFKTIKELRAALNEVSKR